MLTVRELKEILDLCDPSKFVCMEAGFCAENVEAVYTSAISPILWLCDSVTSDAMWTNPSATQEFPYRVFRIQFRVDGAYDETEFDIVNGRYETMMTELLDLWQGFCEENHFSNVSINSVFEVTNFASPERLFGGGAE